MVLCETAGLTHVYDRGGERITPVKDVSIRIGEGDFILIKGASGAGKTTLLMLIGGMIPIAEGDVLYRGKSLRAMSDGELTEHRRRNIGFLFQNSRLTEALTVRENMLFAARLAGIRITDDEAGGLLESLGLAERADSMPHQLSGGQRRRAMLAAVLARKPQLILADEAVNDLDAEWADKVTGILRAHADAGGAVMLSAHNLRGGEFIKKTYITDGGVLSCQK